MTTILMNQPEIAERLSLLPSDSERATLAQAYREAVEALTALQERAGAIETELTTITTSLRTATGATREKLRTKRLTLLLEQQELPGEVEAAEARQIGAMQAWVDATAGATRQQWLAARAELKKTAARHAQLTNRLPVMAAGKPREAVAAELAELRAAREPVEERERQMGYLQKLLTARLAVALPPKPAYVPMFARQYVFVNDMKPTREEHTRPIPRIAPPEPDPSRPETIVVWES